STERSCHDGALFAVDASGGPAVLFWKSQGNRIVRSPTFSPDGTRIAFADGNCDSDQRVWVASADGRDAHPIFGPFSGHVAGVAWSKTGDRMAVVSDFGGTWTFAPDGSDAVEGGRVAEYCWPGRC